MVLKDIEGFEGVYAVTNDGRVWAHERRTPVGRNGGYRIDGGWLTLNKHKTRNYISHRVYLSKKGKKYPTLVHRLVAMAFLPNPNNLPWVNHLDGNPQNNCVDNLEWCTASQNSSHAYQTGLCKPPNTMGVSNPMAILNHATVRAIRASYSETRNMSATSRQLGISRHCVRGVVKNGYWSHVT